MTNIPCPACGHPPTSEAPACEKCGHAMKNGSVPQTKKVYQKPPPPPELEGYVFEKMTPEIAALLGPINEELLAEFQAALREYEETGGNGIEDIIREMEAGAPLSGGKVQGGGISGKREGKSEEAVERRIMHMLADKGDHQSESGFDGGWMREGVHSA